MHLQSILLALYVATGCRMGSSFKIAALEGGSAQMECLVRSTGGQGSNKYLCKGESRYSCQDIALMDQGNASFLDNRFSFVFDPAGHRIIAVHVTDLKLADSGTYWCGSDRQMRYRNFVQIHLTIEPRDRKEVAKDESWTPAAARNFDPSELPATRAGPIIIVIVVSVALLVALGFTLTVLLYNRGSHKHSDVKISAKANTRNKRASDTSLINPLSIMEMTSTYQDPHLNSFTPDALVQSLHVKTAQPEGIYKDLLVKYNHEDTVYHNLRLDDHQQAFHK